MVALLPAHMLKFQNHLPLLFDVFDFTVVWQSAPVV